MVRGSNTTGSIEAANVIVSGGTNNTEQIMADTIAVKGGSLTAVAAKESNKTALSADKITITDGEVTAIGDGTGGALYADSKISLIGGTLTVKAGPNKTEKSAIIRQMAHLERTICSRRRQFPQGEQRRS